MRRRGGGVVRRGRRAFAIVWSLIATPPPQAGAQQGNIADLIFAGRDVDAIGLAKRTFETAPAADRQVAFQLAARVCVTLLDLDCARDVTALTQDPRNAVSPSDVQPATAASALVLWSFIEITTGHYQSTASVLGDGFPI